MNALNTLNTLSTFVTRIRTGIFLLAVGFVAASCAPGTDGLIVTSAGVEDPALQLGDEPIAFTLPHIPVIALPDLSGVGDYDELLQERLGSLSLRPIDGVEVVTAECESGEPVLQGDHTSDVFDTDEIGDASFTFSIDPDTGASSLFRDERGLRSKIETNLDGSGVFVEESSSHHLAIEADVAGAGRYYLEDGDTIISIEADAAGAGVYYHQEEGLLETITIGSDDSGQLYNETPGRLLTIDARRDGTGDLFLKEGDSVTTLRVRGDGSWELDVSSRRDELNVKVLADGSGHYRLRGNGGTVSLDFDPTGASQWRGIAGPQIIVPTLPQFVVADRLPPLGTLATIQPPCATVLRFDSAVLFEVSKFDVLPEAAAVLAEVAPALIEAGRSIEINGHTDANGSDEYNQELSQQRAQAVADELLALGVDVEMTVTGHGESQPVAPNYNEDGSDDEAGQRQNRRVEIVIQG